MTMKRKPKTEKSSASAALGAATASLSRTDLARLARIQRRYRVGYFTNPRTTALPPLARLLLLGLYLFADSAGRFEEPMLSIIRAYIAPTDPEHEVEEALEALVRAKALIRYEWRGRRLIQ